MSFITILLIIAIIVILYYLIVSFTSTSNTLSVSLAPANQMKTIDSKTLPKTGNGASASNFTYSVWFYINDWNYRYGEPKVVFGRMGQSGTTPNPTTGVSGTNPCPLVTLGALNNDLTISLSVFPTSTSGPSQSLVHNCTIQNVPIQNWVNLLISTYGNVLDVYLDGKLVRTCVLPGVVNVNTNSSVYLTPNGGFSGFTSKFQYFPNATDPQTAWNIYTQGYGASWWQNTFGGSYQVQVSLLQNGQPKGSVSI